MNQEKLNINSIDEFLTSIRKWYDDNVNNFKEDYNNAVKTAIENPPPGTTLWKNWKNAEIKVLCDFFKKWYDWNPDVTTGLEYIQQFSCLYYENPNGIKFVQDGMGLKMTYIFVQLNGQKMDEPESIKLVDKWIKELGSKMDNYIIPEGGYKSFNNFFAREVKNGRRPISGLGDDSVVVSPADAVVNMIDDKLSIDKKLNVKSQKLSVRQLLNNSELANKFEEGTAVSCILMPDVYHHFHAPVSGIVEDSNEDVDGIYFGIKDFPKLLNGGNVGYGYDYSIFEKFRRGYLIINTNKFGYVAMIPVGLNTIASVVFNKKFKRVTKEKPVEINKGEEVGYFQYGGSLNILLFEKGCFPSVRIPQGQIIGTLNEKGIERRLQFSF